MKRYGVTITFDYEANDADSSTDIEDYFMDLIKNWEQCFMMDVEVGEAEY